MSSEAHKIIDLYRRHARAFAQLRDCSLIERTWLDRFIDHLPGAPTVLDLGCGTGKPIAEYLSQEGCAVTGVDASPELLEMAGTGQWICADMRGLDLGARFHGILAWHSLFHLTAEDQRAMFATFARHASDCAALMFTTGTEAGERLGHFEGEPLYHASLDRQEYSALLTDNGFTLRDHVAEDPDCAGATVWLAQFQGARATL